VEVQEQAVLQDLQDLQEQEAHPDQVEHLAQMVHQELQD
jgi:hypothetical protein